MNQLAFKLMATPTRFRFLEFRHRKPKQILQPKEIFVQVRVKYSNTF